MAFFGLPRGRDRAPTQPAQESSDPGTIKALCREVPAAGKQVHDANIVATMQAHGERRLLTFNGSDFRRYGEHITLFAMGSAA